MNSNNMPAYYGNYPNYPMPTFYQAPQPMPLPHQNGVLPIYGNHPNFTVQYPPQQPMFPPQQIANDVYMQQIDQNSLKRQTDDQLYEGPLKKLKATHDGQIDQTQSISQAANSHLFSQPSSAPPSYQMSVEHEAESDHNCTFSHKYLQLQRALVDIIADCSHNRERYLGFGPVTHQYDYFLNGAIDCEAWDLVKILFFNIGQFNWPSINDERTSLLLKVFSENELFSNPNFSKNAIDYLKHISSPDITFVDFPLKITIADSSLDELKKFLLAILNNTQESLDSHTFFAILLMARKYNFDDVLLKFLSSKILECSNVFNNGCIKKFLFEIAQESEVLKIEIERHLSKYDEVFFDIKYFLKLYPHNHHFTGKLLKFCEIYPDNENEEEYRRCFDRLITSAINRGDIDYIKKFGVLFLNAMKTVDYDFTAKVLNAIPKQDLQIFLSLCKDRRKFLSDICAPLLGSFDQSYNDEQTPDTELINLLNFLHAPHTEPEATIKEWFTVLDYERRRHDKNRRRKNNDCLLCIQALDHCKVIFAAIQQKISHIVMTRAFESVFFAMFAHEENPFNDLPKELKECIALDVLQSTDMYSHAEATSDPENINALDVLQRTDMPDHAETLSDVVFEEYDLKVLLKTKCLATIPEDMLLSQMDKWVQNAQGIKGKL